MNSQPHQYTEDVPTEPCKFSHWIIHRDDLGGHQEYDTERGVPEIENSFSWVFLALLCATAQQSYCHDVGVRRPSVGPSVRPSVDIVFSETVKWIDTKFY